MKGIKHFAFVAIISMLLSLVAAQVELTIAHGMTGGADKDAFDKIVADFEATNPNIKITQIVQDDDLYEDTGLITLLKSNDPPDIFFEFGGERVASNAANGFAADLTEALAQDGWKDTFIDAAWSAPAGTIRAISVAHRRPPRVQLVPGDARARTSARARWPLRGP